MYTNNLGNICCTTVDYNAHKPYQQLSKMDKFLVAWIPLLRAKTSAFNLTQHSRHSNNANRFSLFTAFQISLGKWFNILNFNENIITRGFTAGLLLLIIGQHLDRQISFFSTCTYGIRTRACSLRVRRYDRRFRQNFRLPPFRNRSGHWPFEKFGLPLEMFNLA